MIKHCMTALLAVCICGASLAADVPKAEYSKDAHTLFLCHFNSADEVKALGGIISDGVKFVTGKFGNGALFEVKGDKITFPAKGAFNMKQGTVEMFIKPTINYNELKFPDDPPPYFFHVFNGDGNYAALQYNVDNKTIVAPIFSTEDGTKRSYTQSRISWKAGEWHHVAFTWGNGAVTIYIDGKLAVTSKYDGGMCKLPEKFLVGSVSWNIGSAHAVIDEMRIYDTPLDFNKAEDW
ncbi:MAG TPA: hypothetical protein DCL60_00240 [Armatimonadetes bacterium]|jgi:hypothetical protein|nr:hypothetical protein [Armatimonadota bacterium]